MIRNIADLTIWDLPEVQASLKDIQEQAPGLSTEGAKKVLMVVFGTKMAYPELRDVAVDEKVMNRFVDLMKAGQVWAGEYVEFMVSKLMRPAYDAALLAGTDPARSLKAQAIALYPQVESSDEEIAAMVKLFQDQDAAKK